MVVLAPAAHAFAERTAAEPHPFELDPESGRRALESHQAVGVRHAAVVEERLTVPGGPVGEVPARIVRPPDARGRLPAVVYVPGAGRVVGSVTVCKRLVADLVAGTGAALVLPDRAPGARYPVAVEECYAVAAWVAERGAERGLSGNRIALVGDSVGGNVAAVVALLAKERGGPPICQQVLFYPATDAACRTASYREFASGPWLGRAAMEWFWERYVGAEEVDDEITASPLRASFDRLAGLPPALIITAEADVLRDEGEAYAARMRAAGVAVTAVRFQGTIHDFVMLNPLAESGEARAAIEQACSVLRHALGTRAQAV